MMRQSIDDLKLECLDRKPTFGKPLLTYWRSHNTAMKADEADGRIRTPAHRNECVIEKLHKKRIMNKGEEV